MSHEEGACHVVPGTGVPRRAFLAAASPRAVEADASPDCRCVESFTWQGQPCGEQGRASARGMTRKGGKWECCSPYPKGQVQCPSAALISEIKYLMAHCPRSWKFLSSVLDGARSLPTLHPVLTCNSQFEFFPYPYCAEEKELFDLSTLHSNC